MSKLLASYGLSWPIQYLRWALPSPLTIRGWWLSEISSRRGHHLWQHATISYSSQNASMQSKRKQTEAEAEAEALIGYP